MKPFACLVPAFMAGCRPIETARPDLTPVGDGLTFLGLCIVLAVLLALIGAFIMKGGGK